MAASAALTVPELQSCNKKQAPCFAWFFCFFRTPPESELSSGFFKTKTPLRGCLFLLDQWSWRESNPRPGKATICFLHAYPALIVGSDEVTGNRITPYLLLFHRQAGETIGLSLSCVRFLIGLVQGLTARETSRPSTLCRDKA